MAAADWRPLLDGDLAARAEDAVHAIAASLAAGIPAGEPWNLSFCLGAGGTLDLALFYGYLARSADTADSAHAERAGRFLDEALENLATIPSGPALYSGFTGAGWAVEHLSALLGDGEGPDDEDLNEETDATLLAALTAPWTGIYDLIAGLAGFGVYALERVPRRSAVACIEAIVDCLDRSAVHLGDGIAWFTSPDLLPPRNRRQSPDGYYNLGVAHGVPGIIGLLADACRLGIRAETARPLLEGAVRWILSHRLSSRTGARYPAFVAPGVEPEPSRLAWCYGDPGVAATLLYAARRLGRDDWERAALDIAAHAARAVPEEAGARDAGLCHGALGLAHIYNRIYQATGDELFAGAARLWYRFGLDMRQPEGGIGGFEAWHLGPDMQTASMPDPGFLTGSAGIGLALLAGFTSVEPRWDRLLMTAIPPLTGIQ
jgi:lantibiotic biosynthesis protein